MTYNVFGGTLNPTLLCVCVTGVITSDSWFVCVSVFLLNKFWMNVRETFVRNKGQRALCGQRAVCVQRAFCGQRALCEEQLLRF